MPILIKEIKPSRLKVDALRLELLNEMRKVGTAVKKDYEKTTRTWKHKPKFEVSVSLKQPGPTLIVETDDEIYRYVDKGTKPHLIFAGIYTGKSSKKALSFPVRSAPKTRPGMLRSMPGFKSSAKVARPYVQHPGSKPRGFEEAIGKIWTPKYKRWMEAAMRKAARASGHAL